MWVARWNGWSYEEKADQLAMNLRGSARTVLENLPEHEVRDFSLVTSCMHTSLFMLQFCWHFLNLYCTKYKKGDAVATSLTVISNVVFTFNLLYHV